VLGDSVKMLHLSVGGTVYVSLDDEGGATTEFDFPTQKARALFVYLAMSQHRQHSRRALAALYWPDAPESGAANNLRQTIHRVRTLLREADADPSMLTTTTQHVALIASPTLMIDAMRVEEILKQCRSHAHRSMENCTICARQLSQAAELLTGPPLADLHLPDAHDFELWLGGQREQITDNARQILHALAVFHSTGGESEMALRYVRQWLTLEPWQEEAHYLAIQLLAAQGKRTAALRQFQQCRQTLRDELGVAPDIRLQQLHDQIVAGNLPVLPTPRLQHAPLVTTPLIGRQAEWQTLEALLNNPANRLITISGPGGVGKTQLALTAGHALARLFRDGAYFVGLDDIQNAAQFPVIVVNALGMALGDSGATNAHEATTIESQILQFLARRNALILIDGSVHLAYITAFLIKLLQSAPDVTLLVTSRVRLDLRNERVIVLDGLSVPDSPHERSHNAQDSLTHFIHVAQQLTPGFALTPKNSADLLTICRLLGGLPLALELAAALLVTYSPRQLASKLAQNLDLIATDWADLPLRQRSLRASFTASWRHLSPDLQYLLSTLAVFAGAFSEEAVAVLLAELSGDALTGDALTGDALTGDALTGDALTGDALTGDALTGDALTGDALTGDALKADLQRLLNFSLLQRTTDGRYSLHAAVHTFAAEHLAAAHASGALSRLQEARAAHLRYYAAWLRVRHPSYAGEMQKECLDQIDEEQNNLLAAWRCAEEMQDWPTLAEMVSAVHAACAIRGHHEECARLLDHTLDVLRSRMSSESPCSTTADQVQRRALAHLCLLRGLTAVVLLDHHLALTLAGEARRCTQSMNDAHVSERQNLEALYWYLQCRLAQSEADWPRIAAAAQRGLSALPPDGDKHLRGLLLGRAALGAQGQGQFQLAIRTAEEGIALLAGNDGDHWSAAIQRANIASTLLFENQDLEAVRQWQESYTYLHAIGDMSNAAIVLDHLAFVEMSLYNNLQRATDLCLQALDLLNQTGLSNARAAILGSLGEIALKLDNLLAARTYLVDGLRIAVASNQARNRIVLGAWLSVTLLRLDEQRDLATAYLCAALGSPLLHAETRRLFDQAVEGLAPSCGIFAASAEQSTQFDWDGAAAALLAPN